MRYTPLAPTAAALLLILSAGTLHAQPSDAPSETAETEPEHVLGEEIVVTANRTESEPEEVGSSVTVIGREEIERRNETTVLELLRTVPGLETVQSGGPGNVASVFLRGANSEHTLVLLDGVRVNSATTSAFDFGTLKADNLERIEVLRGPQSTLYGSEAMGGVVSIVTRRSSEGFRLDAEAVAGSHDHREGRIRLDGGRGAFDGNLSLSRLETDGVSSASELNGNTEDDAYEDLTLASRLGWTVADDARLDLTVRRFDTETELDGFAFGIGPVDDLDFLQDRDLTQATLAFDAQLSPRVRQRATLGTADESLGGADPTDPFNNFRIESRITELSSQTDLELSSTRVLTFGASVEERNGVNVGTFDESSTLTSAYVLHRWSPGARWHLSLGGRWDDDSESEDELTGRFTLARLLGSGTRLHGSAGTGFRTPNFNEQFFPGAGNPTLVPESNEGFDFGVEQTWRGGDVVLDVTGFYQTFDDLIVFDLDTFTFENVVEAKSQGLETSVRWRTSEAFELLGSYTWNDTEDERTGLALARRPTHRGSVLVVFEPSVRWRGTASIVAVRDRIESDGLPLDDYERLDLGVEYRINEHFRPYVRLDNVLDEDYEEVRGFTTPGFSALVGLKASM